MLLNKFVSFICCCVWKIINPDFLIVFFMWLIFLWIHGHQKNKSKRNCIMYVWKLKVVCNMLLDTSLYYMTWVLLFCSIATLWIKKLITIICISPVSVEACRRNIKFNGIFKGGIKSCQCSHAHAQKNLMRYTSAILWVYFSFSEIFHFFFMLLTKFMVSTCL